MITRISGKLAEKKEHSVVVDVQGLFYDVMVPLSILNRINDIVDGDGQVTLITYHYFQLTQASGIPILIGFLSEIEKDFFLHFIKVSGIGPRAAVKALDKPISEITKAIEDSDLGFLKTLPGIGAQRAKEIIAKLQGKVGKFGLIQDMAILPNEKDKTIGWQEEALDVLMQLQYKKQEAADMIKKAVDRSDDITTAEELLNEIYKQKVNS